MTLTDPEAIMAEIARVRAAGHAVIDQEVEIGLRSIAVPLLSARRVVVAAVNLGLPRPRRADERARRTLSAGARRCAGAHAGDLR